MVWSSRFYYILFHLSAGSVDSRTAVAVTDKATLQTQYHNDGRNPRVQRLMRAHAVDRLGSDVSDAHQISFSQMKTGLHASTLRSFRSSSDQNRSTAIVTHICSDDWAPGALALAGSLRTFPLQSDLVIMVPSNVSVPVRMLLSSVFDHVYVEEPILPHPSIMRKNGDCLTLQLRTWQLPYKKALYMDADMIALASPESLFQKSGELMARPDDRSEFNGGMFLCEPNATTFDVLANSLKHYERQTGKRVGIQPFMNFAFPRCNASGDSARSFGHAGCWRANFSEDHNKFSRSLNATEVNRLLTGDGSLYGTVHFSGDWTSDAKPWMAGCMGNKDSTTKNELLHRDILDLWMRAFKSVPLPAGREHVDEVECPAFKCGQKQEPLDYVVFADRIDCVTQTTVRSLYDHAVPRKVIIIAPGKTCAEEVQTLFKGTRCIDEDTLLPEVNRSAVEMWLMNHLESDLAMLMRNKSNTSRHIVGNSSAAGWFLHTLLKMGLAEVASDLDLGDHYVIWDSGMVMIRDFCPFNGNGQINVMESGVDPGHDCSPAHERAFFQLTGLQYAYSKKRGRAFSPNHMVVNRRKMSEFLKLLQTHQSQKMGETHWSRVVLEATCPTAQDCACGFPEMPSYASWMKRLHPKLVSEVPKQYADAIDVEIYRHRNLTKSAMLRLPCCPDEHRFKLDRNNGLLSVMFNRSSMCRSPRSVYKRLKMLRRRFDFGEPAYLRGRDGRLLSPQQIVMPNK